MVRCLVLAALVLLSYSPPAAAGSREDWRRCPNFERPDLALPACTRIIRRRGEGRENTGIAYSNRCALRVMREEYELALNDCNKAIRFVPNHELAYDNRASVYERLSRWHEVIADTTRALEIKQWAYPFGRRGRAFMELGDYSRALADLDRAVDLDPQYAIAYDTRAAVYENLGQWDEVIADTTKALEIDEWAYPFGRRGHALLQLGKYERAIAALNRALELDPQYAYAFLIRGNARFHQGDMAGAKADYGKAIEVDPQYAAAYDNRALINENQRRWDDVVADTTKALEIKDWALPFSRRARALLELGEPERAIKDLDRALELDAQNAAAYDNRAAAYERLRQWDEVITDTTKALGIRQWTQPFGRRGRAFLELGRYRRAIEDLDQAVDLDPQNAIAYDNRAAAYEGLRQWDEVIADTTKALEIRQWPWPLRRRGRAFLELRDYDRALEDINTAIGLDPKNVVHYGPLGLVHERRGDAELAIEAYDRALKIDPNYASARTGLARILMEKGDHQAALSQYDALIESNPDAPGILHGRADVYEKLGDHEKMRADLDRVMTLIENPTTAEQYNLLAWTYVRLGRHAEGLADAERALELRPNFPAALDTRAHIFEALGQREEAIADYRRALRYDPNITESREGLIRMGVAPADSETE